MASVPGEGSGERHPGVRAPPWEAAATIQITAGRLTIVQMFQEIMKGLP